MEAEIKRCRRMSFGSGRYRTALLIAPLTSPDLLDTTNTLLLPSMYRNDPVELSQVFQIAFWVSELDLAPPLSPDLPRSIIGPRLLYCL